MQSLCKDVISCEWPLEIKTMITILNILQKCYVMAYNMLVKAEQSLTFVDIFISKKKRWTSILGSWLEDCLLRWDKITTWSTILE